MFGLLAFSVVAETEKSFPPAVIKLVTVETDKCGSGAFTMPELSITVYVESTMPSDTLEPSQIWITCAYMHENRVALKKKIEQILAASAGSLTRQRDETAYSQSRSSSRIELFTMANSGDASNIDAFSTIVEGERLVESVIGRSVAGDPWLPAAVALGVVDGGGLPRRTPRLAPPRGD